MNRSIEELLARSLEQPTRLLRFDAAIVFSYVPDLHILWPLERFGILPAHTPPGFPGAYIVGNALEASMAMVADEQQIACEGEPWLRTQGAKTVVTVPLRYAGERLGVLLLWSKRVIEVEPQMLRAVTVFSSELTAALRRAPMLVVSDMQRHQIEAVSRIIAAASNLGPSEESAPYAMIARETRLLTGADGVAFTRPRGTRIFTEIHAARHNRTREKSRRTVLCSSVPSYNLTFAVSWREWFEPTEQQGRLLDLISSALSAIEGLRARVAAAERQRRSQYLTDVGKTLSVSLDLSVLFEQIQLLFVPASADWVVVDVRAPENGEGSESPRYCETARSPDSLRDAVRAVSAVPGPPVARPMREYIASKEGGLAEIVVVPLVSKKARLGAIGFGRSVERGPADAADFALYLELSSYVATAIANAATFGKEQYTADILQRALLPAVLPTDGRVLLDAAYAPAVAESQVGGDWYDVFPLDEDRFAVSIGDVGGHGMRAAATMNVVRLAFRAAALSECKPQRVIERADAVLRLEDDPPMVTAIYGIIDLRANRFSYASAGHMPPLLIRVDGSIVALPHGGVPLGIGFQKESARSFDVGLNRGDTVLLYTDGLIEYGHDPIAGEKRLYQLLRELIAAGSKSTLARDVHTATFVNGVKQSDDVAILAISLEQPNSTTVHREVSAAPSSRYYGAAGCVAVVPFA